MMPPRAGKEFACSAYPPMKWVENRFFQICSPVIKVVITAQPDRKIPGISHRTVLLCHEVVFLSLINIIIRYHKCQAGDSTFVEEARRIKGAALGGD
jgi:hypothetical protein